MPNYVALLQKIKNPKTFQNIHFSSCFDMNALLIRCQGGDAESPGQVRLEALRDVRHRGAEDGAERQKTSTFWAGRPSETYADWVG